MQCVAQGFGVCGSREGTPTMVGPWASQPICYGRWQSAAPQPWGPPVPPSSCLAGIQPPPLLSIYALCRHLLAHPGHSPISGSVSSACSPRALAGSDRAPSVSAQPSPGRAASHLQDPARVLPPSPGGPGFPEPATGTRKLGCVARAHGLQGGHPYGTCELCQGRGGLRCPSDLFGSPARGWKGGREVLAGMLFSTLVLKHVLMSET